MSDLLFRLPHYSELNRFVSRLTVISVASLFRDKPFCITSDLLLRFPHYSEINRVVSSLTVISVASLFRDKPLCITSDCYFGCLTIPS